MGSGPMAAWYRFWSRTYRPFDSDAACAGDTGARDDAVGRVWRS
jgi:hypothetical protein